MAHHHFVERTDEEVKLCTEIMAESRRHPEIASILAGFDADVKAMADRFAQAGAERGDIRRDADFDGAVTMLMIIADGVWWRRALDPKFKPETVLPIFFDVMRFMLRGGDQNERAAAGNQ